MIQPHWLRFTVLVLKHGKFTNRYRFKIYNVAIPTLPENPVKALEKWYVQT